MKDTPPNPVPPRTRASLLDGIKDSAAGAAWDEAWAEFHESYRPMLHALALRRGVRPGDADDVVQAVMLSVRRRVARLEYEPGRCRFSTWLHAVASNEVASHFRRVARAEARGAAAPGDAAIEDVADASLPRPDEAWDAAYEVALRRQAVRRVAARVGALKVRIHHMNVVEDMPVAEVVRCLRELGVKPADVHLARHRVQAQIDREVAALRGNPLA